MFLIVPNAVRDAINERLDVAIAAAGFTLTEQDRESLYHDMLRHFDLYGEVPEISVTKREKVA